MRNNSIYRISFYPPYAIIDKRLLVIIHHQRTVIQVRVATHNYDSLSKRITLWISPEVKEDSR